MKTNSMIDYTLRRANQLLANPKLWLIVLRMLARCQIDTYLRCQSTVHDTERIHRKAKAAGITAPFYEMHIQSIRTERDESKKMLIDIGGALMESLDSWQQSGATFADLCDLCGISVERGKQLARGATDERFSALMFISGLDYKGNGDWCDIKKDGPMTHAVNEYMIHQLTRTPEGRQISDRVFAEHFPDIWDNRMYLHTDEDGNRFLVDKDGELVDFGEGSP